MLHAFPLSRLIWNSLTPPQGFELILPDFPGFGDSPLAPAGLTLAEAAQSLENHLAQEGITGPVVLGGISMGGYWAMEFIRQFPQRIEKILFISTRPGLDKPEAKQNRLKMADRMEKEGLGSLAQAMISGLLGKTTLADKPEIVDRLSGWIQGTNPAAVALAQRAMAERRDQTDLMPRLKVKTCVVAGLEDALIPSTEAEAMAKAIAGSQLRLLEAVGHLVPIEDPDRFQKILKEFLSEPA
jgi:pimeloyl-ACP methyl ester carboxylesterase